MKTYSVEKFKIPENIPGETLTTTSANVIGLEPSNNYKIFKIEENTYVVTSPKPISKPEKKRKVWIDYDKNAKTNFLSTLAGESSINGRSIFFFIEKEN